MTAIWRDGNVLRYHWDEEQRPAGISSDWETYLRFRDQFAEVLDPERYTVSWLDRQVAFGAFHVLGNEDACILVEIRAYPTGAVDIHGMLAAGDLSEIIGHLIPQAEEFGRERGCSSASLASRSGWVRALKQSGYGIYQTELRKAL